MRIDSKLVAIDPYSCGCTECLTGVYRPLARATDDDIQALFLGLLDDSTDATFEVTENPDGTFKVTAHSYDNTAGQRVKQTFDLAKIAYPITVKDYTLDLDLDTVVENLVHLRR